MTETSNPTLERVRRAVCDSIVEYAAEMMANSGAPVEMIIDRFVTYGAAQACSIDGSAKIAGVFREVADKIEAGVFHSVTGEGAAAH